MIPSDILLKVGWRRLIREDYVDSIPRNNPRIEARRKTLEDAADKGEIKYQKFIRSSEPQPKTISGYIHYVYGAYELIRCLLS